ncbi:MAG: hypothetical protein IT165_05025 [Bryobacterales bacterium]|nr:hypothetical protein [Bryobacterales bacterium]
MQPVRGGFPLTRRVFLGAAPGAAVVQAQSAPSHPMTAWIFCHSPLERWMDDHARIFDAWGEGGVRGIIVGYMQFVGVDGKPYPSFPADPKVYRAFGVTPPLESPRDPAKERRFHAMLDDAARRGWEILVFGAGRSGGALAPEKDPFGAVGFAAGVQDTMNAYPQAQGVIIDGAGEHHYELAFHHGGELFEVRAWERQRLTALGMDVARYERGMLHLRDRFHRLTPAQVRYHSPAGVLNGLTLFDINEDALYWLRTRQETSMGYFAAVRNQVGKLNRPVKLGAIPRAATFSMLTTQDYERMHPYFDYLFPKHYFWNRGFDGMYGTLGRWVRRIQEWNPNLSEGDSFAVVKAWFGIELPGIHTVADMEAGFPDEFFDKVVYQETRRALAAVGDDRKVLAWVSTGRSPHAGDPMPARDLYRILAASQRAGLKRFVFHPDPDLGAPEWSVISRLCGKPWKEGSGSYWPSNTPRPDTFNGGRKPGDGR